MVETPETETTVEENYEENIEYTDELDEETKDVPLYWKGVADRPGDFDSIKTEDKKSSVSPDKSGSTAPLNKGAQEGPENYKFNIPSTTWEMNQLKEILNNNPWEIKVQIWLFDKSVSQEWFEKLKALLRK